MARRTRARALARRLALVLFWVGAAGSFAGCPTEPPPILALGVAGAGTGSGNISSNVGGMSCSITSGSASGNCTASFNSGTSVTLTATPASGHVFVNWTENGSQVSGSASYTFTASANRSLVAEFSFALPNPVLAFTGTELYSIDNSNFVRYRLAVTNYQAYPAAMFAPAPNLPPCGLNTNASRTWVKIYDASNNSLIYGFCGFRSPSELQLIWFAEPVGTPPPLQVFITLVDRATGSYISNNVVPVPPVFAQVTAGHLQTCGRTNAGQSFC